MSAEVLLFALLGLATFGWDLFADGPRAEHVLTAMLLCVALLLLGRTRGRAMALICAAGAGIAGATALCGLLFDAVPGGLGCCDQATGRPVRALTGVAVILLAAALFKGWPHDAPKRG